jgi:hypothetical protein
MEAIRVYIEEFGRVRDSELDVLPFIIFSGKSGSGKSYMALLCHYFYEILTNSMRLSRFFERNDYDYQKLSKNFRNEGIALEIQKETLEKWLAKDAINYVGTMIANTSFSGSIKVCLPESVPAVLRFRFKEEMTGLVNEEDVDTILSMEHLSYRVTSTTLAAESPFSFLLRHELIQYLHGDFRRLSSSFVFPPSRGPVLTESLTPQTGLYLHFLQDLNELNLMPNRDDNESKDLLNLFHLILDGDIKRIDNKYIYQTGATEIPISAAAASIREIAPLELLVKKIDIATSSVLFEEPEAHLHPLKQRMMADILSIFAQKGTFMQITTHSDYLIRRLNELVTLNELKTKMQDENEFNDFCKDLGILPELSLDVAKLTAYTMESREDGFTSIKRQELALGKEIPYRTFSEAISESMRIQNKLEEALENDCR